MMPYERNTTLMSIVAVAIIVSGLFFPAKQLIIDPRWLEPVLRLEVMRSACLLSVHTVLDHYHTRPPSTTSLDQDVSSNSPLYGNLELRGYWQHPANYNMHISFVHYISIIAISPAKGCSRIRMLLQPDLASILSDTILVITSLASHSIKPDCS